MKAIAIPSRYRLRVKQRLAVVQYAVAHGIKPASRHFGLERKTIRRWRARWLTDGVVGLVPRYKTERASRLPAIVVELIGHARRELEYGRRVPGFGCGASINASSRWPPFNEPSGSWVPAGWLADPSACGNRGS